MSRTQVKSKNIEDGTLTGASFCSEFNIYDETKEYIKDSIIYWNNVKYVAESTILAGIEGDLTNHPLHNTAWRKIGPNDVQLTSGVDIISGDEVCLDINGNLQLYPSPKGENIREFTPRDLLNHGMIEFQDDIMVAIYSTSSSGIYLKPITFGDNGAVIDGNESQVNISGIIISIKTSRLSDNSGVVGFLNDSGDMYIFRITTDGTDVSVGDIYKQQSSTSNNIISFDVGASSDQNNILIGWIEENTNKIFNNYGGYVSTDLDIDLSGTITEFDCDNPINIDITNSPTQDNIIFQVLTSTNDIIWKDALWNSSWSGGNYDDFSNSKTISGDAINICGISSNKTSGTERIIGQFQTSSGFETFFAEYTSGGTIQSGVKFGDTLSGKSAKIIISDSDLVFNLVIDNNDKFNVWKGDTHNMNGYSKIYSSRISSGATTDINEIILRMVGTKFILMVTSNIDVMNDIYYMYSNIIKKDIFIGVAIDDIPSGSVGYTTILFPLLKNELNYNSGDFMEIGPFTYHQIIDNIMIRVPDYNIFDME